MSRVLYLASSSFVRQKLLQEALIPFNAVGHTADEEDVDKALPFKELMAVIARKKMDHAVLPQGHEEQEIFVLAVDSLVCDSQGMIQGKPKSREDAIIKIKKYNEPSIAGTAFCLDKKIWKAECWHTIGRVEQVVQARYKFSVPDHWIERYLDYSLAMSAAGAAAGELYGAQFLEWIDGSYSGIVGLPMFELRQALEHLGFFD